MLFVTIGMLLDIMKRIALPPNGSPRKKAATIIYKIALALDLAHAQAIIHRDIKPENILLDDNDEPILIDWDIGKAEDHQTVTLLGQSVGTLGYMPAEQLEAANVGVSADIYALGVTFKNIVGGLAHPELKALIGQMRDDDPSYRPTASEVADRIAALLPELREVPNPQPQQARLQQVLVEDNSTTTQFVVGMMAAGLAVIGAALWHRKGNRNDKQ
eukprot:TRINITY_DN6201_c0_g1_i1.p1 TRINITY_DN6201_c0_g1~~TRINITY_DN6201_c0_g1_i1.p1  ORF type:complete len:216 (-),score=16.16 TRINITY_DN6201_c0_g1_i1:10-657(-)